MHLRYNLMDAGMGHDENRHAQVVMKELGITYQHATPQSMGDQWWFWNCDNIPEKLPEYISPLDLEPMECIGWGLSDEEALKISREELKRKNIELLSYITQKTIKLKRYE